jgi:hypothetical protein
VMVLVLLTAMVETGRHVVSVTVALSRISAVVVGARPTKEVVVAAM